MTQTLWNCEVETLCYNKTYNLNINPVRYSNCQLLESKFGYFVAFI